MQIPGSSYSIESELGRGAMGAVYKARHPDGRTVAVKVAIRGDQGARERGVVHRDIKPANIIIRDADERPVVSDFGAVKDLTRSTGLTSSGTLVGTPYYMAPEHIDGEPCPASDVWSLGVVLYECLVG